MVKGELYAVCVNGAYWLPRRSRISSSRSDQYSFVQEGIPAVFIRNGADGEEVIKKWLKTRYHTPLDNMEQPIYYETGVRAAWDDFFTGI
jgi:hypothetical protein